MLLRAALSVLALALAGAALVWRLGVHDDLQATAGAAQVTPELVARGAYLARAGNCMTCHSLPGGPAYGGGRGIETPFGTVFSSNLTPDPQTGLGSWSSADFWRALHHGRSRDGRLLYPVFPYTSFTWVTRDDSDALWAYLQSLAPVARATPAHALRWPYNTQAALAVWRALFFRPAQWQDDPTATTQYNRGAYLVRGLGHCGACHAGRNALGASASGPDLAGGPIPMQNWYAPALNSAAEAGVAHWSIDEIVALLGSGVSAPGSATGPMAQVVRNSTQYLTHADLAAVATYLRALPQAATVAAAPAVAATALAARGAKLYEDHGAACHGAQGQGRVNAYPALAGNRAVLLPTSTNLVQMVLYGGFPPATAGNPRPFGMPPYVLQFSDTDVAAVLTHIRGSWGNGAAPVSELEVSRLRDTP